MADKFDISTVKSMDIKAIIQLAKNMHHEVAELVLDKNLNKLKDVKVISKKRKEIARTLTILNQKKLLESVEIGQSTVSDESKDLKIKKGEKS